VADLADAILAETLAEMRIRLALVSEWMAGEDRLERNAPAGGVVGFVRMRGACRRYRRHLRRPARTGPAAGQGSRQRRGHYPARHRRARVAIDATRTVIATGITTRIDEE